MLFWSSTGYLASSLGIIIRYLKVYLSAAINADLDASELSEIESQQCQSFTDTS